MRRRRVWCELLPPEELGASATLGVLERFGLEPIVALPPARETDAMAAALLALSRRGLRVGLWPLLDDRDGYWPSSDNAERFDHRVESALAFADRAGATIRTVAIDLEPRLEVTADLMRGTSVERARGLLSRLHRAGEDGGRERARSAASLFRDLGGRLAARQIETVAATMPMVVLDLASGAELWQVMLETPVDPAAWRVISPMFYTSMIRQVLPSRSAASARAILFEGARLLVGAIGASRASLSLGLVGPGKLGDEPAFADPEELAGDTAAALAAGVEDLALFSLETVLARSPERWLRAFTEVTASPPSGRLAGAVAGLVRAAAWANRPLARLLP